MRPTFALLATALAMPVFALAQERGRDFSFDDRLPPGAWLRVHTLGGDIRVTAASGDRVEVIGRKEGEDAAELRITSVRRGEDVTICAMFEESECDAEGIHTSRGRRRHDDASADFEIRLPRGVKIAAVSGNGDVSVTGATAEVTATSGNGIVRAASTGGPVRASSGNGDIQVTDAGGEVTARSGNGDINIVTSTGPVSAYTGNGRIDARMSSLSGTADMAFRTGNGDVSVVLPSDFEGEIDVQIPNGALETDFPLRVQGRIDPHRVRATIGRGGRRITITSGSGGAEIRKAGE